LKQIHYNPAQLAFFTVLAQITVLIFGRATGKTEGCTSLWLLNNLLSLARSTGGLIVPDYENADKILAGIYKGWEKFGYIEGVHYIIGKVPPKSWKRAYNAPRSTRGYKNYISFYNGSGFYVLSAKSKHNGANLDWLACEEARLIPEPFFREINLTVRGNEDVFGYSSLHGSRLFVTDMPRKPTEQWVFGFEQNVEQDFVSTIREVQRLIMHNEQLYTSVVANSPEALQLENEVAELKAALNELRKGTVYYGYASTLDNIEGIGFRALLAMKQTLSDFDFDVSVLNKKPSLAQNAFYPLFSTKHIQNLVIDADKPLDIALDYNRAIRSLVVGQETNSAKKYHIVAELYNLGKQPFENIIADFAKQFATHRNKAVYFYYDATAKQGKNVLNQDTDYQMKVIKELKKHRWNVISKPIGKPTSQQDRYEFFIDLYGETQISYPKIAINKECKWLIESIKLTESANKVNSKGKTIIIKIKSGETNPNIEQRSQPHLADAKEMILVGKFYRPMKRKRELVII
jgi:hypothetical protein